MKKRIFVFSIFALLLFVFLSCPVAHHCDLRFCKFSKVATQQGDDLKYSPIFTVSNPVGHTISSSLLNYVYKNHPEFVEDVNFDIDGTGAKKYIRDENVFYVIPQELLDMMTPDVYLKEILSGSLETFEYDGEDYKCKYTKSEFFKFTCPDNAPGYYQDETVYYCIFPGYKIST